MMEIFNHFRHIHLTQDQQNAVQQLAQFLDSDTEVFILKGYAGSGKTTLLKGLIDYLTGIGRRYQLMAPTGRAAKVIQQKTGYTATTIHKGIYSYKNMQEITNDEREAVSFLYEYKIENNPLVHDSILIIDEASMVSDIEHYGEFFRFGSGRLLTDLMLYSRVLNQGTRSKLIFIGDPAQIPPIGMPFAPALDSSYIQETFHLQTMVCELREVKRQDASNAILERASKIRKSQTSGYFNDFNLKADGQNIFNPAFEDFLDTYKTNRQDAIIISYRNKTALDLNMRIRKDKFGADLPLQPSDQVIIGSNNYKLDIMNGEFAVVSEVSEYTKKRSVTYYIKGGKKQTVQLVWRHVTLIMQDEHSDPKTVSGLLLENYLYGDNDLRPEERIALYIDFKQRHPGLKHGTNEFKVAITHDAYINCILLKYGYAITCHKAQGGEWKNVFVFWDRGVANNSNFFENPHEKAGKTNLDFYRWAYTAITRSSEYLYCINPPYFTSFSEISYVAPEVQKAISDLTGKPNQPVEVALSEDVQEVLNKFGLEDAPLQFQDHFIRLWMFLGKQYIEIISWEKVGYEIRYSFRREGNTAAFKFWVNGKNAFRDKYQRIPSGTNSNAFFEEVSKLVSQAPPIHVNRRNVEGILTKVLFDVELEERKPFLKALFDSLTSALELYAISISDIEHLEYKERYTLGRAGRECVVDFEYNGKGFFGRVLPIQKRCGDQGILDDLKEVIHKLKGTAHVI